MESDFTQVERNAYLNGKVPEGVLKKSIYFIVLIINSKKIIANFQKPILKIVQNMPLESGRRRAGRPLTANFKRRFLKTMFFKELLKK